jgi:lysophospholipase L1-like esterase
MTQAYLPPRPIVAPPSQIIRRSTPVRTTTPHRLARLATVSPDSLRFESGSGSQEFSQSPAIAPRSGVQLYAQRLNALRSGRLYTRLPADSFHSEWANATGHPSYDQWRKLLTLESRAAARGQTRSQGNRGLTVMVGDSLSQWFPVDRLPAQQIWLNQGISGDTTGGILNRLSAFDATNADTIYVMAGVNDLKNGKADREILRNITGIIQRLKKQHPDAQIVVQSILPTRSRAIPNARIAKLNPLIKAVAQKQGVNYMNVHQQFVDRDGYLRPELTTDGIHLSPQGYQQWQLALQGMDQRLAQRPRTIAAAQALRARSI